MLAKDEITRYVILDTIDITSARQVVKIEKKIPAHVKRCVGVFSQVHTYINTPTARIKIGHFALQLNNEKVHPVNWVVGYDEVAPGRKALPLAVNEDLIPGELITGYYFDTGTVDAAVFPAYKILIILECVAERRSLLKQN